MTITTATPWRTIGLLPRATWLRELTAARSPLVVEADAMLAAAGDDSALMAAMCGQESRYGTAYAANTPAHRNPLNLRPRGGDGFQRFASAVACVREWRARLRDPGYAYAGTVSLRELVHVYAPAADSNDPAGYAADLAARLTRWGIGEDDTMPIVAQPCPIETYVTWSGPNRPGLAMSSPSKIVTHEVGNRAPGADEDMHRRFVLSGGGADAVSFHFVVGPTKIVQLLYLDENAWHASDGYWGDGNRDAWGIEHIQIGDFARTLAHGAWLQAELARNPRRFAIKHTAAFRQDINPENVDERMVRHYDEAPDKKWCPETILDRGLWEPYKQAVRVEVRAGSAPAPVVPSPIWWIPGAIGPVRRSTDGAVALAMLGEVTAKRDVPVRTDATAGARIVTRLAKGKTAKLVGTYRAPNGYRWYFVETGAGQYGRALWSAFVERFPTL